MPIKNIEYIFDKKYFTVTPYTKTIRIKLKRPPKTKGNKKYTKSFCVGVKITQGVCK